MVLILFSLGDLYVLHKAITRYYQPPGITNQDCKLLPSVVVCKPTANCFKSKNSFLLLHTLHLRKGHPSAAEFVLTSRAKNYLVTGHF